MLIRDCFQRLLTTFNVKDLIKTLLYLWKKMDSMKGCSVCLIDIVYKLYTSHNLPKTIDKTILYNLEVF